MKVVTVGTSEITSRMIEAMRNVGIEIYGCVSRDLERAKAFAYKNRVELFADNYDKVLKLPDFDFVYIALPNSCHFEYAKKALENGKNVIVEKPFCLNQKETRELVALALRQHLYIFENMRVHHTLAYKTLKQDIEKIKPIRMVSMNYSKYSSVYDNFKNKQHQTKFSIEYGSGALMDLNCYNISFVVGLFGLPLNSTYVCNVKDGVDISGTAILKYNDFMCNLTSCKDSNSLNYFCIAGENGYIYLNEDPSFIDHYFVRMNNNQENKVEYKELNHFTSMLRDFRNIFEINDLAKYDRFMKNTLMEMQVLDDLRKNANIKYQGE